MTLKCLPADELAHYGGRRDGGNLVRGEGHDVVQEFQQAGCLGVGRGGWADAAQKGLGVVFQHREFENQGRVELCIGIFLELSTDSPVSSFEIKRIF